MSEIVESAAPAVESAPAATASAPMSTSDIAASVDKTLNEAPDRPNAIDSTRAAGEVLPVAPKPVTEAELSEAGKFLLAQGHKIKKEDGRDVWLPANTVEKMLDRYVNQHKSTWGGERSVIEKERDDYRGVVEQIRAKVGDPRAFISALAEDFPQYRAFLEPQAAPAPAPTPAASEMPAPDLRLGDGSSTYSLDGLKRLLEWNTQQVESRLLPKMDERLKPYQERDEAEKKRAAEQQAQQTLQTRVRDQMATAQSWPAFGPIAADGTLTEFQSAVLQELEKDSAAAAAAGRRPSMTIREAFLEVQAKQLAASDTEKRARWIEEQNRAPRSTSVTRQGMEAVRPPKPRSTEEIAREIIERGA